MHAHPHACVCLGVPVCTPVLRRCACFAYVRVRVHEIPRTTFGEPRKACGGHEDGRSGEAGAVQPYEAKRRQDSRWEEASAATSLVRKGRKAARGEGRAGERRARKPAGAVRTSSTQPCQPQNRARGTKCRPRGAARARAAARRSTPSCEIFDGQLDSRMLRHGPGSMCVRSRMSRLI